MFVTEGNQAKKKNKGPPILCILNSNPILTTHQWMLDGFLMSEMGNDIVVTLPKRQRIESLFIYWGKHYI